MDKNQQDAVAFEQRLKRHNHELTILNRIAEALNREVDLPRALGTALENIAQLFDLRTGWIFLLDEATEKFYTAATLNLPPALADHPRRLGGTCHCLDTYRDGDMDGAANINAIKCSRLKDLKEGTQGLKYHASIPLYAKDKKLGVLNVVSTDWSEIGEDDLRLLHTVGDLMSIAIERARLFQQSASIGAANERARLARDIHDTIAQGLAAIALQLETADALLENGQDMPRARSMVQRALELTRANLDDARRSVLDLRAAPLEERTLPEALRELIRDNGLESSLETRCEVTGSGPPLPLRIAVGLYRIAQEAVNNVRQHANASNLTVHLVLMPQSVRLVIEDDGEGFDPAQIPPGHFGLVGLNERARLLGGRLTIRSTPGAGTVVDVNIPLDGHHE
jgi:two-component system NarL family sensor kinase